MNSRPWYKRYGSDFISGTLGMTLEEKGAYSILLDLIYDRGGPIPDDARYIAGVCGCSVRKWNTIRDRLIALGKIAAFDGVISNFRADKELEISAKSADERAESGRKGGEKSAQMRGQPSRKNELDQAELDHTRAVQKPDTRNQRNTPLTPQSGGEGIDLFDQVWEVFPRNPNSLKAQARREFDALDPEAQSACLAGARAYAAGFAEQCKASGVSADHQRRFVKKLSAWIANRGWEGSAQHEGRAPVAMVKLDRDRDRQLWEACEAVMGKKAPTSDMQWSFRADIVEEARKAAA